MSISKTLNWTPDHYYIDIVSFWRRERERDGHEKSKGAVEAKEAQEDSLSARIIKYPVFPCNIMV